MLEADGIFFHLLGLCAWDGFVVGEEDAFVAKVQLRLLVVAADDGVIGSLEEAVFAVLGELDRGLYDVGVKALDLIRWDDGGGGDIVFGLDFLGGREILSQSKSPPGSIFGKSYAQVLCDESLALVDEFVSRAAIDEIDTET